MPALFLQPAPTFTTEQQSQGREWVVSGSTRTRSDLTTKLLFNEAVPASASNRATRVQPPGPIVIEKLLPLPEEHEKVDSTRSSITFTALSEERLQAAVELAKRDLRRRHLESSKKIPAKPPEDASLLETSDVELLEELAATPRKLTLKASSPKEKKVRRAKQTSQKRSVREKPWTGHSPPTRDPSQRQLEAGKEAFLSQQIHKLHNELEVYIQKVEELANRGNKMEELLDPEEEEKLERRRQKQAALTARKIYVLQQQVKEIQDDMEKQKSQKMWDNKQSTAVNKLAATHRGTLRALQDVIHQLSEPSLRTIPPHYKELGQLIRRLSMCSAKVKVDQGSDVPEMAINILQKLEILDSALRKQEILEKVQVQTHLSHGAFPRHSQSPARVFKDPRSSNVRGTWKPTNPIKAHGRRMFSQKPKATSHPPMNRRGGLRSDLESLAQLSWLRELQGRPEPNAPHRKARHPERRKSNLTMKCKQMQDPGFQQPTVSSQLRVNKLPEKVHSFPWIPPSPHSPPPKGLSPQKGRAEPRCLFSPEKTSASSPKRNTAGGSGTKPVLSSEWKNQAQNEALRSKVMSPTQWAERAEQKARERIQPLLDEAQQIGESRSRIGFSLRNKQSVQAAERAAERLSEDLLEGLREDATRTAWTAETDDQVGGSAQCRLQAPTLESMLLRMEEIQRDQEEVRRRFASITYSDPPGWDQTGAMGPQCHASGSRAASPQPIRFTRPVLKQTSAAEIVLEKPMETGFLSEDSLTEERPQDEQPPRNSAVFPGPAERGSGTVISVPGNTLRNIRRYREDFDSYLCVVAHEAVGSFSPWAVADSLAEELLSEALADVAAEFQDVVEEYAEAVFTSEFLQPIQPHPGPAAALEA